MPEQIDIGTMKPGDWSHHSWKRQTFTTADPKVFNGAKIVGACFYQDEPYTDVFPANIEDVEFIDCNLDNCNIPAGATVTRGTNKHIKAQKDGQYWIVDKSGNPVEPRDKARYVELGLSIKPADLPAEQLDEPILITNDPKVIEQRKIDAFLADPEKVKAAALADVTERGL